VDASRGDARCRAEGARAARGLERTTLPAGDRVAVTERGTFFGTATWWSTCAASRACAPPATRPVVFDATHSVQQPGAARAARAAGCASTSRRSPRPPSRRAPTACSWRRTRIPDHAPSDGPNMVPLDELDALVTRLTRLWEATRA
jgi:2-dehydro-3-deoxyphosphooctonate aldolase (KDO 8-P synthase)